MGGGRQDALLHGRGRDDEALAPRLPARRRDARLRRTRFLYEEKDERFGVARRPHEEPRLSRHGEFQPHDVRGARPQGRRAAGRVDARRRARAGPRVRRRPPRRPLLHPDELRRPQLPPRDGARRRRRAARTGRRSSRTAPTSCSAASTSSRTTSSSTSARTGSRASRSRSFATGEAHTIAFPEPVYSASPRRTACGIRASSATSTSPSSRRVRLRLRHGHAPGEAPEGVRGPRRTTGRSTPRRACGPRPRTARRSRSRSSGARNRRPAGRGR